MTESRKDAPTAKPARKELHSSHLPSSRGDSPQEIIPKDISPKNAAWADLQERKTTSEDADERTEALLDEAVDQSFPASDPVAELPSTPGNQQHCAGNDEEEESLDNAIEMTFPASDPIAIPSSEELHHEKDLRKSKPARATAPAR